MRLDVQITDEAGRPVTDIRPEEIQVVEDGVVRPVLLFQRIAWSGDSYLESARRTVAAEISTNQGAPRGQLYVLLIDQDHLSLSGAQRVRRAAEAFVREKLRPHDRIAIYGLPGPGPTQPFTANRESVLDQLQRVRGGIERLANGAVTEMQVHEAYEIVRGNEVVLLRFMPGSPGALAAGTNPQADLTGRNAEEAAVLRRLIRENAQVIVLQADAEVRGFLRLAADVLRGFRGVDGRKTVVLFSEGFYGDNVGRELEDLAAAAAETYSVVHAFDLNSRTENLGLESASRDRAGEILSRLEPLGSLAAETNGVLLRDAAAALDTAFEGLSASATDYYLIGFEPPAEALSDRGRYRRLQVRVTRPGTTVSTRTGYSTGPAPTPADRRRSIDAALSAPFAQQGLRLEYTTYLTQSEAPRAQRVVAALEADLPVGRQAGESADVVFVVRDARTGRVAASGTDRLSLPRQAANGSTLGRGTWRVGFDLPAGDYLMRCVVREPGGLLGSADRRFVVRALAGPDVTASDLVLGWNGGALPVRARAYIEDALKGVVRVYGRAPSQIGALTARMELIAGDSSGNRVPVRTVEGAIDDIQSRGGGVMRDVTFGLPLDGLEPGPYLARAIIRADGEMVADLGRQVEVVAGAPPAAPPAAESSPARNTTREAPRPRDVLEGTIAARLLQQIGSTADGAVRQAALYVSGGRWAEALAALESLPPDRPAVARLRGLVLMAREDYAGAVAILGPEFDARPDDGALAFVLGWARVGAGDRTGAVTAFRNAALVEPAMVPAHLALAETYLDLGHAALAAQALQAGLTKVPESAELRLLLEAIRQ